MSDSAVMVLRSLLGIPVIGPGRIFFLTALMLGERFSVLTLWKPWAFGYEQMLREMGIADRCASIRWPESVEPDLEKLLARLLQPGSAATGWLRRERCWPGTAV